MQNPVFSPESHERSTVEQFHRLRTPFNTGLMPGQMLGERVSVLVRFIPDADDSGLVTEPVAVMVDKRTPVIHLDSGNLIQTAFGEPAEDAAYLAAMQVVNNAVECATTGRTLGEAQVPLLLQALVTLRKGGHLR